jgi:hypothetical protein
VIPVSELDKQISDAVEGLRALTDEVRGQVEEGRAELEARREARKEADEETADARRRGDHGRDWQTLQQRIDLNRTTLWDILTGVDPSEEARAVRKLAQERMVEARRACIAAADEDEVAESLAAARDAQRRLAAMLAELHPPNGA